MRWIAVMGAFALSFAAGPAYAAQASLSRIQKIGSLWELEINADQEFPSGARRLTLTIGTRTFQRSRQTGAATRVIFSLTDAEYAAIKTGEAMHITYGTIANAPSWSMPPLNKAIAGGGQ